MASGYRRLAFQSGGAGIFYHRRIFSFQESGSAAAGGRTKGSAAVLRPDFQIVCALVGDLSAYRLL